jgi:hypothetical protein
MILLRLRAFGEYGKTFPIQEGETLLNNTLPHLLGILGGRDSKEVFKAVVNGHLVESDWEKVILNKSDVVVIYPCLLAGDDGRGVAALAFTAAVIAIAPYAAPSIFAAGAKYAAIANTALAITAQLAFNALVPPSFPNNDAIQGFSGPEASQMYAISGQSNQVKKFKTVPKVYGRHKVFPTVAANPYTELQANPDTGELDQYLYAIYDFGLGPMVVEELRIGDTPITEYTDVTYNFVDPNKPDTPAGNWDTYLNKSFSLYKGDAAIESLNVVLNGNRVSGGVVSDYQVIRNTPTNLDGVPQSITLTFVNPNGLYAFDAVGTRQYRSIDLIVEFAPIDTEDWRSWNDLAFVSDFDGAGGESSIKRRKLIADPLTPYAAISPVSYAPTSANLFDYKQTAVQTKYYGYPAGTTQITVKDNSEVVVGTTIWYEGKNIGKVVSIANAPDPAYMILSLDMALVNDITIYTRQVEAGTDITYNNPFFPNPDNTNIDYRFAYSFPIPGGFTISRNDVGAVYSSLSFTPKNPGQYRVRVTREVSYSDVTNNIQDGLTLQGLTTRFDRAPIKTLKRHTFLEIKIRATNQLNGTIQNLSAVCTSVLDTWNELAGLWEKQATANPAWVFVDLLTGETSKKPIPKNRLHLPSILEWRDFCDEVPDSPMGQDFILPRFQCNFVLDYDSTLQQVLNSVTSASQASLNVIDGQYGVLIDKLKTVPVQIFTPRNSRDFTSKRAYTEKPHAVRVKYIDPVVDFQVREVVVYDTGYNEDTATEFDELTSFACTNAQQAWRYGRYMLAQNRLRQETIEITVDFEHLVCTRGDYVKITQDVMRVGGTPARVKSKTGNRIVIDDGIDAGPGTYGYIFRKSTTGEIFQNNLTIVSSDTFDLVGTELPSVGDLVVIGLLSELTFDCIVKAINPNPDLTATITLVEKADGIYTAESTDTIPDYVPQLNSVLDPDQYAPPEVESLVVLENTWRCNGTSYQYYISLDWNAPNGAAYEIFEVYVNAGRGFNIVGTTRISNYEYIVSDDDLGREHQFKILAVSPTGKKIDLGAVTEVAATPVVKTTPPSNVANLSSDITGEVLQLSWTQVSDCDVIEYLIRYSPNKNDNWEATIPLLRVNRDTTLATTQARTGVYLIKSVDFNGNESDVAARAVTTIPSLFGLNVIDEITDFPLLTGPKDRVRISGSSLILEEAVSGGPTTTEYYTEGYYYYTSLVDMESIYTARIQSQVRAQGYALSDVMSNWVTLSSVTVLSNAKTSEWDVETQYRGTDILNVLSSWPSLSVVDPISGGVTSGFTEWKKFTIGDVTARVLQFRLKLISNKKSVTPRVLEGTIKVDMPDRDFRLENLSAPTSGLDVVYTPSFKGPGTSPNIQISIDGAETGDYWQFDYKTLDGFKIRFFDKNDNPVARVFDVAVKGFGYKNNVVI